MAGDHDRCSGAGEHKDGGSEMPIAWVAETPVPARALERYQAELALAAAGLRLGIPAPSGDPGGAGKPSDRARADAYRIWSAKALLVDQLLAGEAKRLGVRDPAGFGEWLSALEAAGELVLQAGTPSDARASFQADAHRLFVPEARRVRHLLVDQEREARQLRDAIEQGRGFDELARACSLDAGSRDHGGDLGWVERGQLSGTLEATIFTISPQVLSPPLHSVFGWHVLRVEQVRPARERSFEECREELLAERHELARRAALRRWLEQRLAEGVRVGAGLEHPLMPGIPGTPHRH